MLFYRHEAISWHRAYDAQTANVQAASLAARAKQIEANLAKEAESREKAQEAQEHYETYLKQAVAHARRLPSAAPSLRNAGKDNPGRADTASEGGGSPVPQESPSEADMVAMTREDAEVCAVNYSYSLMAHEWAKGL